MRSPRCQRRLDLLAMPATHKHTLARVIPEPKPNLPEYYPPGFESIPLSRKAPLIKVPNNAKILFRGRVGTELYARKDCQFDLNDPYMRNVSYKYDSLHDPALQRHFKQSATSGRLKNLRILGPNGEAYCTLKDYNDYRRYLYGCHIDRVKKVRRIVEERETDFRNVQSAIQEASRADNRYKARIKAAKEQAKRRIVQNEVKRAEKFERAEFKRRLATKRVEEMARQKARQVHDAMDAKRRLHEQHAHEIAERDFHRKLLLDKCNVLKMELAEKRKVSVHLQQLNERSQRGRVQRDRQFAWREAKEKHNQNLLVWQEETQAKKFEQRLAKMEEHRVKSEEIIEARRIRALGKSYESKEVSDIVTKMMKDIKFLFEADYLDESSNPERRFGVTSTIYESLSEDVVRRAVECTYRHVRQLKIPVAIRTIIEQSVSCLQRFADGHGEDRLHQDARACRFVRKEIDSIVEEVRMRISAFLSRSYANGSIPKPSDGKAEFIRNEVLHVIQQSTSHLDDSSSSAIVRDEVDDIIDNVSDHIKLVGYTDTEFVQHEVDSIIEQIGENEAEVPEEKQNIAKQDKKTAKFPRLVSFDEQLSFCIPSSTSFMTLNSNTSLRNVTLRMSYDRTPTPVCSISNMVSIALLKLESHEPEPLPDRMNTVDLIHFHTYQKNVIYSNLNRFANLLRLKLERFCDNLNFGDTNELLSFGPGDEEKILDAMVKSILTYSDQDLYFGQNIVMVANLVWSQIMQNY